MGHAYHGQQGQLLPLISRFSIAPLRQSARLRAISEIRLPAVSLVAAVCIVYGHVNASLAQGIRDRTRPKAERSTTVTESQAVELTLTLTEVAVRPIQVWVRTAGAVDAGGRTVTVRIPEAAKGLVAVGQRARAFPPESRSSMYQARVTQFTARHGEVVATVTLAGPGREGASRYIVEIVTEPLEVLSVPNEAVIESGGKRVVYVREKEGRFGPRDVSIGLQGELYTQVLDGLEPGEQVVTFGSFFIDADHKLKGS